MTGSESKSLLYFNFQCENLLRDSDKELKSLLVGFGSPSTQKRLKVDRFCNWTQMPGLFSVSLSRSYSIFSFPHKLIPAVMWWNCRRLHCVMVWIMTGLNIPVRKTKENHHSDFSTAFIPLKTGFMITNSSHKDGLNTHFCKHTILYNLQSDAFNTWPLHYIKNTVNDVFLLAKLCPHLQFFFCAKIILYIHG